jgi:hypothetical protein
MRYGSSGLTMSGFGKTELDECRWRITPSAAARPKVIRKSTMSKTPSIKKHHQQPLVEGRVESNDAFALDCFAAAFFIATFF